MLTSPGQHPVRVGILLWPQDCVWVDFAEAASRADAGGLDSIWTWDHLYAPNGDPHQATLEGWMLLAGLAPLTHHTTLGLLVGANTFRNPAVVAKLVVTLDHLSAGRAVLGMGAAWFEQEHRAHGIEFGTSVGQRLDWLEESVTAMQALLNGESVTSPRSGHYSFDALRQTPGPVRGSGSIPLLVGGRGKRKTLRTVAKHADAWNTSGPVADLAQLRDVLRRHCDEINRDLSEIELTFNANICIRATVEEGRRAWDRIFLPIVDRAEPNLDWDWFGPPETIAERWRPLLELGFRHVVAEMPAPYDLETLDGLVKVRQLVRQS